MSARTKTKTKTVTRDWPAILSSAADIVRGYSTPVTLRQLFYRLVAAEVLPNEQNAYKSLSHHTAEARRGGRFPTLADNTRRVHGGLLGFSDVSAAIHNMAHWFELERSKGQPNLVFVAVEKDTMVAQLAAWFGDYGVPILALRGYASQSYADEVAARIRRARKPAVFIYAGDHDPSGEDIDRDFIDRVGLFGHVRRIAVTREQIEAFDLPEAPGKPEDSRAAAFEARHGKLVQVELEALPPDALERIYREEVTRWLDLDALSEVSAREDKARAYLRWLAANLPPMPANDPEDASDDENDGDDDH